MVDSLWFLKTVQPLQPTFLPTWPSLRRTSGPLKTPLVAMQSRLSNAEVAPKAQQLPHWPPDTGPRRPAQKRTSSKAIKNIRAQ